MKVLNLKDKIYIHLILFIGVNLIINSCKYYKDNLTPSPKLSLESATASLPQNPGEIFQLDSLLRVPYGGIVKLTFNVTAEAGIQQIDYKVTGNVRAYAVNSKNDSVSTSTVPFDWGGLVSIRNGFDSDNNFTFSIILPNDTAKTIVTIQVTDKNNLSTYISRVLFPVIEGPQVKGIELFSQNASASDAGGAVGDLKVFLASSTTLTYDSSIAQKNSEMIDISFADSSGTLFLVSPESRVTSTDTAEGVSNLKNSLKTVFVESPSGFVPAVATIFSIDFKKALPQIKVSAGKTYLYENSAGSRGVIKINSINNGIVSGKNNTSVDFDYILYIPLHMQ